MSRLLVSKYRTRNQSLATSFIIPFDAGVHSYVDKLNGRYRLASPYGWSVIRWLQESTKNPILWKNYGHDHFVIFSLTIFVQTGVGVKEFFKGICQNCSVLSIESTPTRTSTLYHLTRKYWYPIPYPSSFHWWEGIQKIPWKVYTRSSEFYLKRDILSLFIGSTQTKNIAANAFRRALQTQCRSSPSSSSCHWYNTTHSCNGIINAIDQMKLFQRAQYCLSPPGDTVTRKSLFDALIAGCVPVIFAKATITQYSWYFTMQEIEDISIYISIPSILVQGTNFISILSAIPKETLLLKQRAIEKLAPRLQYSVIPAQISQQINISTIGNSKYSDDPVILWEPPYYDAVNVVIDKILDHQNIQPLDGFTIDQRRRHKCIQNDLISYHYEYGGLFKSGTVTLAAGKMWKNIKCLIPNPKSPYINSTIPINEIIHNEIGLVL